MENALLLRGGTQPRVMLVEDDEYLHDALASLLERSGYGVEHCRDGKEALGWLQAGKRPDLILLDLNTPNVDGWQFRVEQRRVPSWAGIPVVVMSGEESAQAKAVDADAYFAKPFEPDLLLHAVRRLLARAHERQRACAVELSRISSLGIVAAGIAHEINNPLAVASGSLALFRGKWQAGAPAEREKPLDALLQQTDAALSRIAEVARAVSAFARPLSGESESIDVKEVLEATAKLVTNELRHRSELERHDEDVPRVVGNRSKLGQALLSILVNVLENLRQDELAKSKVRLATERRGADRVLIRIEEWWGASSPAAASAPSPAATFTIRAVEDAARLGLEVATYLIDEMNGTLTVQRTAAGAVYEIALPVARAPRQAASSPSAEETAPAPADDVSRSDARPSLLIIDDEALLGELLSEMLGDDYEVSTICSPHEALRRLLDEGESYDAVLCDVMMPDLSGMELYERVARARPEQARCFAFMTGGSFSARTSAFLEQPGRITLLKPFSYRQARDAVDSVRLAPPKRPIPSA